MSQTITGVYVTSIGPLAERHAEMGNTRMIVTPMTVEIAGHARACRLIHYIDENYPRRRVEFYLIPKQGPYDASVNWFTDWPGWVKNPLCRAGFRTPEEVFATPDWLLAVVRNVGAKAIAWIRETEATSQSSSALSGG